MHRQLYERTYFNEGAVPKWRCPTCLTGSLTLNAELFVADNAETRANIDEEYFDGEQISRVFNGALSCANCGETVVFSGSGGVDREHSPDKYDYKWVNYYVPRFFYPAMKIINMPETKSVPRDIKETVEASFLVFWCNLDSCANRLRTGIELLLDSMAVVRKVKPAAKKELTLQQRIERIDNDQFPHIAQMLNAIKIVGNDGSHDLGQVTREDILCCYEILEHVLELVYPTPSKTAFIAQMAQKIIEKNSQGKQ